MNIFKIFLLSFALFFALGSIVLAQEEVMPIEEVVTEAVVNVNLDEDIQPQDLEVREPRLLPDNPFYFLKNWARTIREVFAFAPVKKVKLRVKFANERLMEMKKMIEQKKDPEIIKKATENYQEEVEKIKNRVEKIKEKARENPEVDKFLDKFIHQQTLHQKLLQRLETQVPAQAFEKIKEARERHLERFGELMTRLEDRLDVLQEKLEKITEEQKGSKFKEFKNLEVLKNLEEKVPEQAKEAIRKAQENALKRLQGDLEKMSPQDQERFKEYIERISGEKEKHLEILENIKIELKTAPVKEKILELKENLEKSKVRTLEKIEEKLEKLNCPLWTVPKVGFCQEGRIIIEKDPKTGCPLPPRCVIPGEMEIPGVIAPEEVATGLPNPASVYCKELGYNLEIRTNPDGSQYGVCIFPDGSECEEWTFFRGECGKEYKKEKEVTEKPIFCITLWDPVCGQDGKTYSNECFAKLAGVKVVYRGKCEEKECQTDADCPPLLCLLHPRIRCPVVQAKCIEGKCKILSIETPKRKVECQTDLDCRHLFCPQVIGMDTPLCDLKTNTCYCGTREVTR